MWLKFETIGQKKYISPVKLKNVKSTAAQQSARALKKTSGDLNLGHWRALQGLPSQDTVKRLLLRVVNRMISLEQMFHEGDKIKKSCEDEEHISSAVWPARLEDLPGDVPGRDRGIKSGYVDW